VRGSNVGTRLDLDEAVAFALRGQVAAKIETAPLSSAMAVLNRMRKGKIVGRVVLTIG
jgi:propanol-preferring alcohol dehydrogenase